MKIILLILFCGSCLYAQTNFEQREIVFKKVEAGEKYVVVTKCFYRLNPKKQASVFVLRKYSVSRNIFLLITAKAIFDRNELLKMVSKGRQKDFIFRIKAEG
jgi:hypothetical protein